MKTLIVIAGPTASGKTGKAVADYDLWSSFYRKAPRKLTVF